MSRFVRWLLRGLGAMCAVAAVVLAPVLAVPAAGAQTGTEHIVSYDVAIAIQRDASILVSERIVYDFGSQARHGIVRTIPVLRPYDGTYNRYYPLEVRSVQSPDAPAQYTVDNSGRSVIIKIGDPNRTVSGVRTYRLTYLVRDSLTAYTSYDELYWNAIGAQWDVPIDRATVRVTAPAAPVGLVCFIGSYGSTDSCQQASLSDRAATFTQAGLDPLSGFTVAVDIPKGVVTPPHPVLKERRWSVQRAFALTPVTLGAFGGLLVIMVILGALVLPRARRQRAPSAAGLAGGMPAPPEDAVPAPPEDAVPASGHDQPPMESAPPEDVRPGQAGTLLDGVANPRDVTATIVDLAVREYLRIEDTGEGGTSAWRLVRLGKTGGLLDYEQILLDGLFMDATEISGEPSVRLSELGSEFASELKRAQDALYTDVARRGWFTARPDRVRQKWLIIGAVMSAVGAIAVFWAAYGTNHLGLIPIPLVLAGLALMIGSRWMPVRTPEGTALTNRVEGFRRYIRTAAVAQAPAAGQPDTLYDYLPLA